MKLFAALLAFLLTLCALLLAGCGGGGDASTSTGAQTTAGQGTASAPAASGGGKGGGKGAANTDGGGAQQAAPAPQRDSGGGATQFETHGGDNSIQGYGGEAGGSELEQAAAALHAYLDARAGEEWAKACDNLAAGVASSLEQLSAASSQGKGKGKSAGCPQLLAAVSAGMPAYLRHDLTQADVGALRVHGDRAFLLYHGAHHTDYFMPMAEEGGQWKVAALAASALP